MREARGNRREGGKERRRKRLGEYFNQVCPISCSIHLELHMLKTLVRIQEAFMMCF